MAVDNRGSSALLWLFGWLLVSLALTGCPQALATLTSSEIAALMELRSAVPQFYPSDMLNPDLAGPFGLFDYEERLEWPTTENEWLRVCALGDGPNVYGLTCRDGHIHAASCMYFATWGDPSGPLTVTLSRLGGLTYLKEFHTLGHNRLPGQDPFFYPVEPAFTRITSTRACYDFLGLVLDTPTISLNTIVFASDALQPLPPGLRTRLESHLSLQDLRLGNYFTDPTPLNLAPLTGLRKLYLMSEAFGLDNGAKLASHLPPTLPSSPPLEVSLIALNNSLFNDLTTALPQHVTSLSMTWRKFAAPAALPTELPSSIHTFSISGLFMDRAVNLSSATSVRTLNIYSVWGEILGLPPQLRHFACVECRTTQVPDICTLPSPPLETLHIESPSLVALPNSLGNCLSLKNLTLNYLSGAFSFPLSLRNVGLQQLAIKGYSPSILNAIDLMRFLTQSVAPTSLRNLTLDRAYNVPAFPIPLDRLFPNLESLTMQSGSWMSLENVTFSGLRSLRELRIHSLGATLPPQALVNWTISTPQLEILILDSTAPIGSTFNWNDLPPSISSLQLSYCDLVGTIPETFFALHPNLHTLSVSGNQLSGTIPWYGWARLQFVDLNTNMFDSFPSIYGGAPQLITLHVHNNQLQAFPDDASFRNMPKLQTLYAHANHLLRGPLPTFWSNHPSIRTINFGKIAFGGPLPSTIKSKRLRNLEISGPGTVCGRLPDFPIKKHMHQIDISDHQITDSIPLSWQQNLIISQSMSDSWPTLALRNNRLNGTLPPTLVANGSFIRVLSLVDNQWLTGTIPNLQTYSTASAITPGFSFRNTSLDVCTGSLPVYPIQNTVMCDFPFVGATCACPGWWGTTRGPYCEDNCTSPIVPPSPPPYEPLECAPLPTRAPADLPPPQFRLPPPAPVVVSASTTIEGDLIIPPDSSITFSGLFTLNVTGCLSVPKLNLELDNEAIKQIENNGFKFTAIVFGDGLCDTGSTSAPEISVVKKDKNCKQVKADGELTTSDLTVVLKINSSQCRIWWIVLASVIGFVFVATIVITLVFILRPKENLAARLNTNQPIRVKSK